MVKVSLTRGEWDLILVILNNMHREGYLVGHLIKEISNQIDSQEY